VPNAHSSFDGFVCASIASITATSFDVVTIAAVGSAPDDGFRFTTHYLWILSLMASVGYVALDSCDEIRNPLGLID